MVTNSKKLPQDYANLDDETLMRWISQAHDGALAVLYDRHGRLVFSVAHHMVGHQATAEEITLDVFRQVWEKAHTYRADRASVRTWLVGMARHRAIDVLRREQVRPEGHSVGWAELPQEIPSEIDSPETAVSISLDKQRVRQAVAELPPEQQSILALAYFNGYSHSQIAAETGLPLGTVKTRLRLALQKLREQINKT